MNAKLMLDIYELSRGVGMSHIEAMGHAKLISPDLPHYLNSLDAIYTSAYIAIREEYSKEHAKALAQEYVDGLKALADSE